MNRRLASLAAITAAALLLTGCTMTKLPTYDTVRDETTAAIELIADQLPETTRVQDIPNEPYGCENDSVLYTGHWVLFQPAGFDGEAFIDALPDQLGEDFVVRDLGIESSRPNVHFIATAHGETQVGVATGETDGEPWVDITALSRCAEPPTP